MNNRPPARRGLGRGLGSLIPSGPVLAEPREERADEVRPTDQGPAPDEDTAGKGNPPPPSAHPSVPGADWIGRIPPPPGAPSGTGDSAESAADRLTSADEAAAAEAERVQSDPVQTEPHAEPGQVAGQVAGQVPGAHFAELPVASIHPNPRQPRQVFDEEAMAELVHSIREVGLLQPVVVRATGPDRYELIMGERRLRATQQLGLEKIPAIVRETGDDALLRDALLENLHRAELNPLEEAAAYQQLLDDFGCTHDELATRIGRSRPQISNTLRLLKLSPAVQRRVAAGVLSAGHARTLLSVSDPAAQDRLANRVVAEGISVRGLEELVAVGELGADDPAGRRRRPRETGPELSELTDRLSDVLDTRVKVDVGRNKGRLTIEFASLEDLHRIVGVIDGSPNRTESHSDD